MSEVLRIAEVVDDRPRFPPCRLSSRRWRDGGHLDVFQYDGRQVRVIIDGEPWFVLADLCRVLDIANPSNVASRLDPTSVEPPPPDGG